MGLALLFNEFFSSAVFSTFSLNIFPLKKKGKSKTTWNTRWWRQWFQFHSHWIQCHLLYNIQNIQTTTTTKVEIKNHLVRFQSAQLNSTQLYPTRIKSTDDHACILYLFHFGYNSNVKNIFMYILLLLIFVHLSIFHSTPLYSALTYTNRFYLILVLFLFAFRLIFFCRRIFSVFVVVYWRTDVCESQMVHSIWQRIDDIQWNNTIDCVYTCAT